MYYNIIQGDCIEGMKSIADGSVQCCVTSPPYWGLRDYGHEGQLGLEQTPQAYVDNMVAVFREVRRILADDGTLWLNLGDSYFATTKNDRNGLSSKTNFTCTATKAGYQRPVKKFSAKSLAIKPKDLVGMPWRVAFALQADGWWLRQDIIWHKPNPMPESVTDRCTKAHEYVFLLTKSARYYYDSIAIQEDSHNLWNSKKGFGGDSKKSNGDPFLRTQGYGTYHEDVEKTGRNKRSVWSITTKPYSGAHFAVMPEALVEPCIMAGSKEGDTIFDPFTGSGTVGAVALRLGRKFIGTELNPNYIELAANRIDKEINMFTIPMTG